MLGSRSRRRAARKNCENKKYRKSITPGKFEANATAYIKNKFNKRKKPEDVFTR